MAQFKIIQSLSVALVLMAALSGCRSGSTFVPTTRSSVLPIDGRHSHSHQNHSAGQSSEIENAMARLSPADRQAAARQRTCPVTGEPLGSMGVPIKVRVKGQDVFVCCAGCKDAVLDEPDKFLAKLKP